MPTIVRWYIRTALIFFVLALATMLIDLLQQTQFVATRIPALRPVGLHLLMVGWASQMIMGVGLWMFPKHSPEHPRGSEPIAWITYVLINVGLMLRALGEPLSSSTASAGWGWLLALSAIFQLIAGWLFVGNSWARIRGR